VKRGTVVLATLDPTIGQEQRGTRPCVVVSDDVVAAHQRFPVLVLVPLTSTRLDGMLYTQIEPTQENGLKNTSYALVDQIRVVDKARVLRMHGHLSKKDLDSLSKALRTMLGL
jgi:mRNA interferase MazF